MLGNDHREPRYCAAAPTFRQVKDIYWTDMKRMIPPEAMRGPPVETTLTIPLWHGGELFLMGMDRPERIEGPPLDHILLDEYANMKPTVWTDHVRPALSTLGRPGSADFIGVPEGRNHFYKLAQTAKAHRDEADSDWDYHHWPSWEILEAAEIEAARRDLDDLTFDQEYGGEFVLYGGRAYYAFGSYSTAPLRARYDRRRPLVFCFDFNVQPGVAAVCQELPLPVDKVDGMEPVGTAVIGEAYIPNNSTTPAICRKLLDEWSDHPGPVQCYGDPTGGARGTAKTEGSDWEIIRDLLRKGDGDGRQGFGDRVTFHVKPRSGSERARINAMNSRLRSSAGLVRLMVDPVHAPHVVLDFEGVTTLEGGTGEIDKKGHPQLSHITDALGYYVDFRFPVTDRAWSPVEVVF